MKSSLIFLLAVSTSLSADAVLEDRFVDEAQFKSISVSPGLFTDEHLEEVARASLKANTYAKVARVKFYGEHSGAPLPQIDHVDYASWRRIYDQAARTPNEFAEMIAIAGNAVLRVHHKDGSLSRRIVAGADPLLMPINGNTYELLNLSFGEDSRPGSRVVRVFTKTGSALSETDGAELLRKLQADIPSREVFIVVRQDDWFIAEPEYPYANPFTPVGMPPSADAHRPVALRCGRESASVSCRLY